MTGPITSVMDLPYKSPDIIIVGGGTAGLVVANRLSEEPTLQILVIEAGIDRHDDPKILTPGLVVSNLDDPDYSWRFMSEPQVSRLAFTTTYQCVHLCGLSLLMSSLYC